MTPPAPAPADAFRAGPSVAEASALRAWLDETAAGERAQRVRLPVVITRSTLGISSAWVGTRADAPDDALRLRLDDGALGVSLADQLDDRFGAGAGTVVVWLEGVRGGGNPLDDALDGLAVEAGEPADGWRLSVRAVGERVEPSAQARAFVRKAE